MSAIANQARQARLVEDTAETSWWPRALAVGISLTLIGAGAASLPDSPGRPAAVALLGAAVTILATALVWRQDVHRQLSTAAQLTVTAMIGPVTRWRCTSWRGWFIGTPGRIAFRYLPVAAASVKRWPAPVVDELSGLLGASYRVVKDDPARGRIRLARKTITPDDEPPERPKLIVEKLLGEDARLTARGQDPHMQLRVRHDQAVKASDPGWRAAVERVISTSLPGQWRAGWDLEADTVVFEQRPTMPKSVLRPPPPDDLDPDSRDFLRIPLGVDEDARQVCWNLASSSPHLLVAGKTGKGKTTVLNGVARELSARQIAVWAADPKRIELMGLRDIPNVQMVVTTPEEMVALIYQMYAEMERRYQLIEAGKARTSDFPYLVILIDEFAEFVARVTSWWNQIKVRGMPAKCPAIEIFASCLRLMRKARMHAVVGIQRPDVSLFGGGGETRDNFDARLSLGSLTRDGSEMMWGSMIGCTIAPVRGRALASADDGDEAPREIQTYWLPETDHQLSDEDQELLAAFRAERVHPRLRINIPSPDPEEGEPPSGLALWEAIQDATLEAVDEPEDENPDSEPEPGPGRPALRLLPDPEPDEPDPDTYDPPATAGVDTIRDGDLMWRDEPGAWVTVTATAPDPLEAGLINVDWQTDQAEGTDALPADTPVKLRRLK